MEIVRIRNCQFVACSCVCCDRIFGVENAELVVAYLQEQKLVEMNVTTIIMSRSIFVCVLLPRFFSSISVIYFLMT